MKFKGTEIIEQILQHLDIKAPTFAEFIGVTYQRIFDIQKGKTRKISADVANAIVKKYPQFNINWLLTGEGEMLKSDNIHTIIDNKEDYEKAKKIGLPLLPEVDFKFSAGNLEIFNNPEFIKRYWYLPDCKDCDGIAQVAGTSMLPAYPPGCWVALKRVGFDINTPNQIPFGQVFGIVVEDFTTGLYHGHIKILRRYKDPELSKTAWIARSLNTEEFDDFDIPLKSVKGLWIVKQHIVSDMLL